MTVALQWMDHRCAVEAPPPVARALGALFPALMVPAHVGDVADVRVTARGDGWLVRPGPADPCPSVPDTVSAAELAITRHLLASDRAHCHLHTAGAVTDSGGAVLAVGPSGSGKSTVAYAWHGLGRPLLGDDVVALDPTGRAHPFQRPLKVDADRLREAGVDPATTTAWDGETDDVWVDPTAGAGWAGAASVILVAELRFEAGAPLRLDPLEGGERLRVLLNSVHQTGVSRAGSVDRLISVAEAGPMVRVTHGNGREAAAALLELTTRCR
ncbi:MAG: hypothetical protein RJQ04_05355 [Longimicrobiales bacterium]